MNMRKILLGMLVGCLSCMLMAGVLAGCSSGKPESSESARSAYVDGEKDSDTAESAESEAPEMGDMFEYVGVQKLEGDSSGAITEKVWLYREKTTDVLWVLSYVGVYHGSGSSFTPIPNADGGYLTYKDWSHAKAAEEAAKAASDESADKEPGESSAASTKSNPVSEFAGEYAAGRAQLIVKPLGNSKAKMTLTWAASATEASVWEMTGVFDPDEMTIVYEGAVKTTTEYSGDDGTTSSETVDYEDGTGYFDVKKDDAGNVTLKWHDSKAGEGADLVFRFQGDGSDSTSE